jgi:hypothetical protein
LRILAFSPVWWFLALALAAGLIQRQAEGLRTTTSQLAAFGLWAGLLGATGLLATGAAAIALMLGASMWYGPLFYRLRGEQPLQTSEPYYSLADWAAESTPRDSLFMVPTNSRGTYYAFRAYSGRSVLVQVGTGEAVISDPGVARLFWPLINDVMALYQQDSTTTEDFLRVAREYDVDYIVTDDMTLKPPTLKVVYSNKLFVVFEVPR